MRLNVLGLLLIASLLCGALPLPAAPARIVPGAPTMLLVQGVAMAPLRAIADIAGATIADNKTVHTVTLVEHTFTFAEGEVKAWHDGELMTLPQASFTLDGNFYVPLRSLVTALGGTLKADALGLSLEITLPHNTPFTVQMQKVDSPSQLAGAPQLYLVAADGSRVQQLSYEGRSPINGLIAPAFSADGASLIYQSGLDILSRRLDSPLGSSLTATFSKDGSLSMFPQLGPDGQIYFMQQKQGEGSPQLCRMHVDGSGFQALAPGARPLFNHDGSLIAYTSTRDMAKPEAHIMNADGSKDHLLGAGFANALSPDGAMLYFTKLADTPDADKGGMTNIKLGDFVGMHVNDNAVIYQRPSEKNAFSIADLYNCDFSPDGKQLVYATAKGLLLMDADGKNQHKLSESADSCPKFTTDGKKIAFLRDKQLFLMNADGSNVLPLATGLKVGAFCISPDGAALAVCGQFAQPAGAGADAGQRTGTEPTQAEIDAAKKAGTQTAVITTEHGTITVALYGKDAPLTVANFVKLVKNHFYDGLTFHRVEPGFVVQGGDPNGDGSGGPGYTIKLEIAPALTHVDGALAMASTAEPDSAGSQFYITLGEQHDLDGRYAVFGKVTQGLDVVKKIRKGDMIVSITMK